jgi:hypothetical protein
MRGINQKAKAIFEKMTEGMTTVCSHRRFDNAKGVYMAAIVECIGQCDWGLIFSVAHYYEQCGDLVSDPEMTFLQGKDGNIYPLSYQQAGLGIYQESILFGADGNPEKLNKKLQKDHAIFAAQWFENIQYQQQL